MKTILILSTTILVSIFVTKDAQCFETYEKKNNFLNLAIFGLWEMYDFSLKILRKLTIFSFTPMLLVTRSKYVSEECKKMKKNSLKKLSSK